MPKRLTPKRKADIALIFLQLQRGRERVSSRFLAAHTEIGVTTASDIIKAIQGEESTQDLTAICGDDERARNFFVDLFKQEKRSEEAY
jgi:hypothetical protein